MFSDLGYSFRFAVSPREGQTLDFSRLRLVVRCDLSMDRF